jgi:DNA invertase Pin-like site-specific DNA recombinase
MTNQPTKKILYVRVSTVEQNTDRQRINEKDYNLVLEDRVSGTVSFFEREQAKKLLKYVNDGIKFHLYVHQMNRLGRVLLEMLTTLDYFTTNGIPVTFLKEGLCTLDADGKKNPMTTMVISMLGSVSELERENIRDAQREGIQARKLSGGYTGRKQGTKEDASKFLSKYPKEIEYLRKSYTTREITAITGASPVTLGKIRKAMGT